MKARKQGRHSSHGNHEHQCFDCKPNLDRKVLPVDEIMLATMDDDKIFTLKVYAAAFHIAMQEFTGRPLGEEALALLDQCTDEIARGHTVFFR
jgi:hypothetical protein